jgi:hypothetical protein
LEPRWLLSIGDLDVRCGVNSKVVTDFFGSGQDSIRAMALQPDGKIVVVGQTDSSCGIVRYQPDGHLDTSATLTRLPLPIRTENTYPFTLLYRQKRATHHIIPRAASFCCV